MPKHYIPRFEDQSALRAGYGFEDEIQGPSRLPGRTWQEGNMFSNSVLFFPNCDMENAVLSDKVWENGNPDKLEVYKTPSQRVLGKIFYSNAVRRLQAVEQLTLPPKYTTIPNTAAFSRFEHIWGSVLFVRQMNEAHGISGKEAVTLELRTLVSDIAHTYGSHLGDWMFQGIGGAENQHDLELTSYLEAAGINDILREHDFEPETVIFPEVNDWVEADQPDLCVDRVDYGLREMNRWNKSIYLQGFSSADFTITPDGMLAMNDVRRARIFAEGFLLLSQEHWSEPTHRFLIDMLMVRTKAFYGEGGAPRSWVFEPLPKTGLIPLHEVHPRDLMYVTEPAQEQAYALPNLTGHTLEAIMTSIARYRRQYVWPGRENRIGNYMEQFTDAEHYKKIATTGLYKTLEHRDFGSFKNEYPESLPTGFAILDAEEAKATEHEAYLDFPQSPFKLRQIDPLIKQGKVYKRLSEIDESFATRLEEHKRNLQVSKIARLAIADPKTLSLVKRVLASVDEQWKLRLENSRRLNPDELKSLIQTSSSELFGSYPFMDFFSF